VRAHRVSARHGLDRQPGGRARGTARRHGVPADGEGGLPAGSMPAPAPARHGPPAAGEQLSLL
jgi:hypothetical protein